MPRRLATIDTTSPPDSAVVLMYHAIDTTSSRKFRRLVVSASALEDQLAWLREAGLQGVGVTELIRRLDAGEDTANLVGLTFDDAYADFAAALPILLRHDHRATLYVPTAFVGSRAKWLERVGESERKMIGWDELEEVVASGIECGSHGHSHLALDTATPRLRLFELSRSRALLEERLGRSVTSLCYPYGYNNPALRKAVGACGYATACAIGHRPWPTTSDRLRITRLPVRPDDGPGDLTRLLRRNSTSLASSARHAAELPWRTGRRLGRLLVNLERR